MNPVTTLRRDRVPHTGAISTPLQRETWVLDGANSIFEKIDHPPALRVNRAASKIGGLSERGLSRGRGLVLSRCHSNIRCS